MRLGGSGIGALAAAFLLVSPASAQTLTAKALEQFVEESLSNYGDLDTYNFEDILFGIAKKTKAPDAVIAAFANQTGATPARARALVSFIIDMSHHGETCDRSRDNDCQFRKGTPLYERAEKLGLEEPTGGFLFFVAVNVGRNFGDPASETAIAELGSRHPASTQLLGKLYAYGHDAVYLMPLMRSGRFGMEEAISIAKDAHTLPPDALVGLLINADVTDRAATIFAANAEQLAEAAVDWDGWADAMLEAAEQKARSGSPLAQAGYAQAALMRKLALGMTDEAVQAWHAYPASVRALLPMSPAACTFGAACDDIDSTGRTFADEMAAALWTKGHRDEAMSLASSSPPGFKARKPYDDARHASLMEALAPKISNTELFGVFVEGKLTPPADSSGGPRGSDREQAGWLFKLVDSYPALRSLVAARLRSASHADMADYLDRMEPITSWSWNKTPKSERFAFILPPSLASASKAWRERIAEANRRIEIAAPTSPVRVSVKPLDPWWTEKKLPAGMAAWNPENEPPEPPANLALPIDPYALLRHEIRDGKTIIIYQSADYDLPGEIPAFGIWFMESDGKNWERPVYLGLQQHFPYVVAPQSKLPLMSASGKLTIEVRAEEIDADSISFPPVGLSLKRSETGLYLEFDLATLRRDRDADGLADIEERRIGLDFDRADTDGDGMIDGIDPVPLIPLVSTASRQDVRVARAITESILGHDAAAIMVGPAKPGDDPLLNAIGNGGSGPSYTPLMTTFLVADASLFEGISPRFRLMLYSRDDLKALANGSAPFFPPRIISMFSSLDGQSIYVDWSAGWVGGAFYVRCKPGDDPCKIETVSEWIT